MKKTLLFLAILFFSARFATDAEAAGTDAGMNPEDKEADATFVYSKRGNCELLMDIYYPREGSQTLYHGKKKPAILFSFGGGFAFGDRKKPKDVIWFNEMARRGYTIISIDYRLALKGVKQKGGLAYVDQMDEAIHAVVEDIFAATDFLLENEEELGIDAHNIVLAGSSAGAIGSLQADYELCNRTSYAQLLPEDFHYAGVIAFAGAILSREGYVDYRKSAPAPTMMLHGTADKVVNYKQIKVFNLGFFGGDKLAKRFKKFGYNYRILRFKDNGHEIANSEMQNLNEVEDFIQLNVMDGQKKTVDALLDNPAILKGTNYASRKELYAD